MDGTRQGRDQHRVLDWDALGITSCDTGKKISIEWLAAQEGMGLVFS
jgi:hypothetical protein